jgi:hypothetical protein
VGSTHDDAASQGWSPFVLDTNGNGKLDTGWDQPTRSMQAGKDKRIITGPYGINTSSSTAASGLDPGLPRRHRPFDPKTQLSEYYEVPWKNAKAQGAMASRRAAWASRAKALCGPRSQADTLQLRRRLCKGKLNGPIAADAQNVCPEGWRTYQLPGPEFECLPQGTQGASAEAPYAMWVDQFDTLGFGKDTPIATASQPDALAALVNGKWVVHRVPYPMSYYAKGMDGRIDDARPAGKGRVCSRPTRCAHRRISKAARDRPAKSCTSNCVPIRSRNNTRFETIERGFSSENPRSFFSRDSICFFGERPIFPLPLALFDSSAEPVQNRKRQSPVALTA